MKPLRCDIGYVACQLLLAQVAQLQMRDSQFEDYFAGLSWNHVGDFGEAVTVEGARECEVVADKAAWETE